MKKKSTVKSVKKSAGVPVKVGVKPPGGSAKLGYIYYHCPSCGAGLHVPIRVRKFPASMPKPPAGQSLILKCIYCKTLAEIRPRRPNPAILKMTTKRCPTCGWEGVRSDNICGADSGHTTNAVLMYMRCTVCAWEGKAGNAWCPFCGQLVTEPNQVQRQCTNCDYSGLTACVKCPGCNNTTFPAP